MIMKTRIQKEGLRVQNNIIGRNEKKRALKNPSAVPICASLCLIHNHTYYFAGTEPGQENGKHYCLKHL